MTRQRKALVVGVDYYASIMPLYGCVNDAKSVRQLLANHGGADRRANFGVESRLVSSPGDALSRGDLKDLLQALFAYEGEVALFYFAGHGHIEATGGYLCTSECRRGDDGLSLTELLAMANLSKAMNTIVILDSCHSGVAGNPSNQPMAELRQGMTILTASTKDQYATEENGGGLFTSLFVDAMNGAAANLVGDITPGSVYAHIDQSLGPWRQRPVFKTNVINFVSLRQVPPTIELPELRRLAEFFPESDGTFALDPSYEPELRGRPRGAPGPNPVNTAKFAILQKYNRVNLLRPVGAPHMWHAAIESKGCRLTDLGKHYRRLVEDNLI